MIKILGNKNSIINQYIAELRDINIQKDSMRFRTNLERLGALFGYEISKTFAYEPAKTETTFGTAEVSVLKEQPVLVPVLRAGLPMHKGSQNIFDSADSAFISAHRKISKNEKFIIKVDYISCPEITGKTLIMLDPMLATGSSIVNAHNELLTFGKPKHIHIAIIIASTEGIDYLKKRLPSRNITLWIGAVDDELTAQAYIVPGLGDAGDLAFGQNPNK